MPRLHHAGTTVTDLDRAVDFYRDVFDFEVLDRFDVAGEAFATAVDDAGAFHADLPDDVETVTAPQTTASGATVCFLRDPEGNLVEVIEG